MFDAKRAKRAIQFIELLKLTGDFNGQPNVLMDWNKKVISDVFGTLNNRGYRQYRTIYITTAKKNIKSQLMSDIACLQLFNKSEPNGQIVLGAGSHEQARMDVYEPLVEIIEQDDELLARLRIKDSMREIENKETGTILKVISSENYCVHPQTLIEMADGRRMPAREVRAGDQIISWDGEQLVIAPIFSVERQKQSPIYHIKTHRGREIRVTSEHPFLTMTDGRRQQDQTHQYKWIPARELRIGNRLRVALKWPEAKESGDVENAWALGAWTGDGECGRFRFINADDEIVQRMGQFMRSIGSNLKSHLSTRQKQGRSNPFYPQEHEVMGIGPRRKSPGREWVREHFGERARSHSKKIPDCIWQGGKKVWAAYLAGWFDTDGCVPKTARMVRLCSVNPDLLESGRALFARLGINACVKGNLINISGYDQLKLFYEIIGPYMALSSKREMLVRKIDAGVEWIYRAHTTDFVVSIDIEEPAETISLEVNGMHTHVTDGLITHNTKHGWNISLGGIDELHVLPNRGLYDVIEHGSGLARRQPMRIYTTTAGDDPDRVSIAWEVHEKAVAILKARAIGDKEHDDPTFYPVIFAYDGEDIYNEENWYKANPSLGVSIQVEDLRELAVKAKLNKSDERLFRWLNLNQWVTTKLTTWLPLDLFDATETTDWSRTDLLGKECYMGGDFSTTTDLSAICLVFPPQEGLDDWRVIWDCWIPQESMQERIRADHVPYDEWASQGWIFVTEGDSIDYLHIKQRILELREMYDVVELDADPSFATMLLQELAQEGMKVVEIKQTYQEQTAPMNHLEVLLRQRRTVILPNGEAVELPQLTHEAHPVARWCFGNASIHKNGNSQIKLVKEHRGKALVRSKRIDLTTAWVLATTRAMLHKEIKSVYEKRGVRRLGEKQDE